MLTERALDTISANATKDGQDSIAIHIRVVKCCQTVLWHALEMEIALHQMYARATMVTLETCANLHCATTLKHLTQTCAMEMDFALLLMFALAKLDTRVHFATHSSASIFQLRMKLYAMDMAFVLQVIRANVSTNGLEQIAQHLCQRALIFQQHIQQHAVEMVFAILQIRVYAKHLILETRATSFIAKELL